MRRFYHVPTIYVLSKEKKNEKFLLKIVIFTAICYCNGENGHLIAILLKAKYHIVYGIFV